jgi:hypothetical protein
MWRENGSKFKMVFHVINLSSHFSLNTMRFTVAATIALIGTAVSCSNAKE